MLCLGQQFVAYAIHPDTGRPTTGRKRASPISIIDSLPAIDEAQARAFLDEAVATAAGAALRRARLPAGADRRAPPSRPATPRQGTPDAVQAALAFIPNADLDYDSWVRIGLALKGALGDAGADLFAAWSAQSAKNDPAFTVKTWAGFKPPASAPAPSTISPWTRGWKPDAGARARRQLRRAMPFIRRRALLATIGARSRPPRHAADRRAGFELVIPDGVLGDLTRYMIGDRPAAAAAAVARCQPVRPRRADGPEVPNREQPALATSTSSASPIPAPARTTAARSSTNSSSKPASPHHLGGNKIASGAGLLTAVHRQPAILFQIDEFGMFLSAAADRRRSPRHITDILDNMTELYTAAGGIFLGAEYANRDGQNERRDINQPCLCVYGTTTPLHFWNALQGSNVVDGSLARFIILPTEDDYPEENAGARHPRPPPQPLIDELCASSPPVAGAGSRAIWSARRPGTKPRSIR